MLAIVIIVRKSGALSSPSGYGFNNCAIAIASWINAVIIGSHFFIISILTLLYNTVTRSNMYNRKIFLIEKTIDLGK